MSEKQIRKLEKQITNLKADLKQTQDRLEKWTGNSPSAFNEDMYAIEVSTWENGSGNSETFCLTDDITKAVIIKEALKKMHPLSFNVSCNNQEVKRKFEISVVPEFNHDVREFVTWKRDW